MKVLKISANEDLAYLFEYPQGVNSPTEFIEYIKKSPAFIELKEYRQTGIGHHPYYVEEEAQVSYFNTAAFETLEEDDIEVVSKQGYLDRFTAIVHEKCPNCKFYEEHYDPNKPLFGSCRYFIRLDGSCRRYKKKDEN